MKTTYFGRICRIYMDLPLVYYLTWGFYSHVWYRQSRKEMTPDPAVEWLRHFAHAEAIEGEEWGQKIAETSEF